MAPSWNRPKPYATTMTEAAMRIVERSGDSFIRWSKTPLPIAGGGNERRRIRYPPCPSPVRLYKRSEEGSGGKECVSTCRSRCSPYHKHTKKHVSLRP